MAVPLSCYLEDTAIKEYQQVLGCFVEIVLCDGGPGSGHDWLEPFGAHSDERVDDSQRQIANVFIAGINADGELVNGALLSEVADEGIDNVLTACLDADSTACHELEEQMFFEEGHHFLVCQLIQFLAVNGSESHIILSVV